MCPFNTQYTPAAVFSAEEDYYDPEELLVNKVYDGQEITVQLTQKVPLNERHEPKTNPWSFLAFRVAPDNEKIRQELKADIWAKSEAQKTAQQSRADMERLEQDMVSLTMSFQLTQSWQYK